MNRPVITFILVIFFTSCAKGQAELNFQKTVIQEIFPALLDSLHFDRRLAPPPPPPPEWNDSVQGFWQDSEDMVEYKRRTTEIENDPTLMVIAIRSTTVIGEFAGKKLVSFYKEKNLKVKEPSKDEQLKMEISDLRHNEKVKLIHRSDLPEKNVWKKDYNFHLSGIFGFSRILFDETKTYGILRSGFSCGPLCGFGGYVFIRKNDGKWRIDRIEITEVS